MAKKATANTIPKWIPLSEAKQLVVDTYESKELAERLLVEWLGEAKVRWRSKRFEGPSASALATAATGIDYGSAPVIACSEGDAAFWHTRLKINWEENSAIGSACAYGIEVAREDVLALLPEEPGEPEEPATAKVWIVEEARQMKRDGKIPKGINKTDFAQLIEERMIKAVRAGTVKKAVGWPYIKNQLSDWGLWPISSIK